MNPQLTLIGLNQVGLSLGMALASKSPGLTRIGIDRSPETALQAQKKGQVDKTAFNLEKSVAGSGLVLLCLPPAEVKETLTLIAPSLSENAVVLDTSPLAAAAQQWAAEILPENRHFLTFFPTLNPVYVLGPANPEPRADLFKNGQVAICCSSATAPQAVSLAAALAGWLDAAPLFCDPLEFQGWHAQTHALAQVLAAAQLRLALSQPSWQDAGRIAGASFAAGALPLDEADPAAWFLNRENLGRVLDQFIAVLQDTRRTLAAPDPAGLESLLSGSFKARREWEKQRRLPPGGPSAGQQVASSAETLGSALGITQLAALFKPKKQE